MDIKGVFSNIKQKQKLLSIPSDEFMLGNKIYNRKFLMEQNLSFDLYNREDVLFNYEVFLLANKLKFVNNPIYFYRKNRECSLTSTKYMLKVTVKLVEKVIEKISARNVTALYNSSVIRFSFFYIASELANSSLSKRRIKCLLQILKKKLKTKRECFSSKFLFYSFLFFLDHSLIYYYFSKVMRVVYRTIKSCTYTKN